MLPPNVTVFVATAAAVAPLFNVAPTVVFYEPADSCFPNDKIGSHVFTVDIAYTTDAARAKLEEWLDQTSAILFAQTHIRLELGAATQKEYNCNAVDINDDSTLIQHSGQSLANGGLYIWAVDNCQVNLDENRIILGAAFQSSVCNHLNQGIILTDSAAFDTVAHEVGHLIGAEHPFDNVEDQGKYGGIMDYNRNGLHNGIVQFKPDQKTALCTTLRHATCRLSCNDTADNVTLQIVNQVTESKAQPGWVLPVVAAMGATAVIAGGVVLYTMQRGRAPDDDAEFKALLL